MSPAPYDAVLLLSFGGPEKPEDVVPFLENVTRGRGIPRERLVEVGEHYYAFGGKSPINDQNRDFLSALRADLAEAGIDLPVYWGNRNWQPYLTDTLREMTADGIRRAAVFATSAYSSYSSCRQYRENLYDSAVEVGAGDVRDAPILDKLRPYYDHPGFVAPVVDGVVAALDDLPAERRDGARILFVTHSIPTAMNDNSGRAEDRGAYVAQHLDVSRVVAEQVAARTGVERPWELVYCSRSGPPHIPWLEPDVNDRLEELATDGVDAVVMCPIGFVSDHMEVIYDLDTEAMATCAELGVEGRRSATAGTDPRFVAAVRELVLERAAAERGETPERACVGDLGPRWDRCPIGCCARTRGEHPALAGEDSEQYA